MNQWVAECQLQHLMTVDYCWRPDQGKQLISCVANRLPLPFPGDIFRFGVSSTAAHQLSLLQAHKPFRCSTGDGCIWGIWHREKHTETFNMHQNTARKPSKVQTFNQKSGKLKNIKRGENVAYSKKYFSSEQLQRIYYSTVYTSMLMTSILIQCYSTNIRTKFNDRTFSEISYVVLWMEISYSSQMPSWREVC